MPQISKVRIVNFSYNDGNRLIADELYDFANKECDDALNVLINLANGGGKSVLVQLMMQPIIPKAKVAGRRIESFFNKTSDHCFILLEWLKDNSNEKLLTGIAMAASEASLGEDDSSRGMSVKYYTFYANYSAYITQYDIVNMPLSRKEKGKFIAEDFDFVRMLARKSNGVLNYYAADDNPKWQRKLAEYGLVQSEWHMIEKLNSEEGGLSKFFGDFKTSDQLIDRLLIPTIEGKLDQNLSQGDGSLSSMLYHFARQCAAKQEIMREQEIYQSFVSALGELHPLAEKLWSTNDSLEHCLKDLFGFSDALDAKHEECVALQDQCRASVEKLQMQAERVDWESVSAKYYQEKETFDQALRELEVADENERQLKEKLKKAKHDLQVLECADYYQKILRLEGEIAGIRSEIERCEHGGDAGQELASLKYSVFVQVSHALGVHIPERDEMLAQRVQLAGKIKDASQKQCESEKAKEKAKEILVRSDEALRNAERETDREVDKLGIDITRRLDGLYASDELEKAKQEKENEQRQLNDALIEAKGELNAIDIEFLLLPQKKADVNSQKTDFMREKKKISDTLEEYHKRDEQIKRICAEFNLNYSLRFTDHFSEYFRSEIHTNETRYADTVRKISIAEEELAAAKRGSMHVPSAVIDYLNSTGVHYTTCEKYLLEEVDEGKISRDQCLDILKNYPAAAYGILMDSSEKERFFAYGREKWLPVMIPLYTYEQMAQILGNLRKFDGAIAFYSEEYFADKEHYVAQLEQERQKLLQQRDVLLERKDRLEAQQEIVRAFCIYTETWEKEQANAVQRLVGEIQKCDEEIGALNRRSDLLIEKKNVVSEQIETIKRSIESTNRFMEVFSSVQARIASEYALSEEVLNNRNRLATAEKDFAETKRAIEKLESENSELETKLHELDTLIEQLNRAKSTVGDECPEAETISGSWEELYSRYQSLQASLNSEVSELHQKLRINIESKEEWEKKIREREIEEEEYKQTYYSSERFIATSDQVKKYDADLESARLIANQARERKGRSEGVLQSVENSLLRFGKPLEKSEIGTDFDKRRKQIDSDIRNTNIRKAQCEKTEYKVTSVLERLRDRTKSYIRPERASMVKLEDDFDAQFRRIIEQYTDCQNQLHQTQVQVQDALHSMKKEYSNTTCGVLGAIDGMIILISNQARGDRYYTLLEHIDGSIQNAQRAISKIQTDLKEIDESRKDLIHQCILQGQRIYEGLKQMAGSSRVTVYEGKDKKQMIRFDIPSEIDAVVANASVTDEINKGTRELVAKMSDDSITEAELNRAADRIVGSRNLLRKYIGRDSIKVDAYKIDQNPQNAGYRTWEKTQVNNSGAEKFVVYFAVILSLMNYTRGDIGSIRDEELRSALILDNPFGATSSKHILKPMFAIAKHFRVQMVCLSDINKSDVINCFDIVIRAMVKKRPMSTRELLTHDGNELIEHGFYRSEQLSLE